MGTCTYKDLSYNLALPHQRKVIIKIIITGCVGTSEMDFIVSVWNIWNVGHIKCV